MSYFWLLNRFSFDILAEGKNILFSNKFNQKRFEGGINSNRYKENQPFLWPWTTYIKQIAVTLKGSLFSTWDDSFFCYHWMCDWKYHCKGYVLFTVPACMGKTIYFLFLLCSKHGYSSSATFLAVGKPASIAAWEVYLFPLIGLAFFIPRA